MHKIERDCLVDFFDEINQNFEYVVMRNADELPFDNFSNDIDILINKSNYKSFEKEMKKIFLKNGFDRLERTSFHGIECYTFYNIQNEIAYSLKIDLFFNYEGGGVLYYKYEDVIKFKTKNANGISVFDNKTEGFLTVLKTLAAGGIPKEHYLNAFLSYNSGDKNELLDKCTSASLKKHITKIIKTRVCTNPISRRKITFESFLNNFKNNPFKSVERLFYHYKTEISRGFKKQYMVVFVGPDGSGKSSLIDELVSNSKSIFRSKNSRFEVFHHRPHILPNISQIFKKEMNEKETFDLNFNPHSDKQSNSIISFFKILYYILDYILGYFIKLIPLQRENKFVIFDRYYYDFIVDQKRSALSVNKNLAIWLYKIFIPKPNKIFFIKVDAQSAHDRKKELSVKAIEEINSEYDNLSQRINNFIIIPNINFEEAKNNLIKNYILLITNKLVA